MPLHAWHEIVTCLAYIVTEVWSFCYWLLRVSKQTENTVLDCLQNLYTTKLVWLTRVKGATLRLSVSNSISFMWVRSRTEDKGSQKEMKRETPLHRKHAKTFSPGHISSEKKSVGTRLTIDENHALSWLLVRHCSYWNTWVIQSKERLCRCFKVLFHRISAFLQHND